jgi:tetratricopeptide (TPR) repeat protein
MRLEHLLKLLEETPDDSFLLFAVGKEYEKAEDFGNALSHYRRLQAADPDYVGLYYHLGKLLETLERPEEALEAYDAGIAVAKAAGDRHAWSELAAARLELDDEG